MRHLLDRLTAAVAAVVLLIALSTVGASADSSAQGDGQTVTVLDSRIGRGTLASNREGSQTSAGPVVLTPQQLAYQYCTSGAAANMPSDVIALCAQFMTPAPPGTPAPPPPTAADIAASWSQSATLPNPRLRIRPGYAVTGLTAYLEIGTPSPWTVTIPDPVRNDAITVSCGPTTFDVNWGDGSPVEQTTSTGGPYPNGDVTHDYQQAAPSYTVTVTEHWACRWSDPQGNGGTLTGLRSAGRLPLEVREIQSTN